MIPPSPKIKNALAHINKEKIPEEMPGFFGDSSPESIY